MKVISVCVPISHLMFWELIKKKSQSGYIGREERRGKLFEVNEVLSIRKPSLSLNSDGGYHLFTAHENGHVF